MMENKFFVGDDEFTFKTKFGKEIEFYTWTGKDEKCLTIKIDENNHGWDQGGLASIDIPENLWTEFVAYLTKVMK